MAVRPLKATLKTHIIKWTVSGEPKIGIEGHQDSKSKSKNQRLYDRNYERPCTYVHGEQYSLVRLKPFFRLNLDNQVQFM